MRTIAGIRRERVATRQAEITVTGRLHSAAIRTRFARLAAYGTLTYTFRPIRSELFVVVRPLTPVRSHVRASIHSRSRGQCNFGPLCYTMQSEETKDHGSAASNAMKRMTPNLCRLKSRFGNPLIGSTCSKGTRRLSLG
jgi:hypothetical protein